MWFVYILECEDGRFYTGITNNIERRMQAHQKGRGARFTRIFKFKQLLFSEKQPTKVHALKRESQIKRWPRSKKERLVGGLLKEKS